MWVILLAKEAMNFDFLWNLFQSVSDGGHSLWSAKASLSKSGVVKKATFPLLRSLFSHSWFKTSHLIEIVQQVQRLQPETKAERKTNIYSEKDFLSRWTGKDKKKKWQKERSIKKINNLSRKPPHCHKGSHSFTFPRNPMAAGGVWALPFHGWCQACRRFFN